MKKGEVLTGIVDRVDFPNKGVVITQEGSCIVKNVLPGQKITFAVQKKRNGRAEGRLLTVEENAPTQIESPCPHFGSCGGCIYLSLPYDEQLKIKETQVRKLLEGALSGQSEEWIFEGIKESPAQTGYRNKMEFSFGDEYKDGPLSLGMHKRGSFYDIVTVKDCQIVDEDYRKILAFTRDYFDGCSFYHRLRHTGYLRHLLVRKAYRTGEILIALVTTSHMDGERGGVDAENKEKFDLERWKKQILNLDLKGEITGVLHVVNDSVADVVQSDRTDVLYGQDFFYEELLGLKFKISTFSFFQTNSLGAEVLYETAREYIGDLTASCEGQKPDKLVFDLYSGTGTIAQLMAPVAKKVIGVEIVEEAVEAAKRNAELNGLHNCEFIAGDVLKVLNEIEEKPDMIVLDPPRDGVHPKALKKIIAYGVNQLVYISCKPTSLARDLEVFLENGYVVKKAVAVDQFPWTANVETVALLSLKNDTPKIEVTMEVTADSNYRPKEKATYQNIKKYVKDNFGVNVHTRYIAEVKRMCGLEMGENHHKSQKENPEIKHCPPAKMMYIEDALKYFGLI